MSLTAKRRKDQSMEYAIQCRHRRAPGKGPTNLDKSGQRVMNPCAFRAHSRRIIQSSNFLFYPNVDRRWGLVTQTEHRGCESNPQRRPWMIFGGMRTPRWGIFYMMLHSLIAKH